MSQATRQRFSFEDYLLVEEMSPVKHEFLGGEVWAMAGGSPDHAAINVNVGALLSTQLRGKPCRVYDSNLRVRVRATGLGTYPDVTVICDRFEADPEDRSGHTALNPRVIVEVLSPSTEEYDRGEKLSHYRQIDTLAEIVLVAHDRRQLDVWRRLPDGAWTSESYRDDAVVPLRSLGCELPLGDVYRDPLRGETPAVASRPPR